MKLIIQIPCFNEANTLPAVISDLPKQLDGIDTIEYLIIDDGSSDATIAVAEQLGVHHILSMGSNHGLAMTFIAGIQHCLSLGADIIVNTDGDNQYDASYIKNLIAPVLDGSKDIVVGARPIDEISHFSPLKKLLQRIGSHVVRQFSGTDVPDTTSGFRAYSAKAAMRLHVFNRYTYTLETIIQAGHNHMRIGSVPIGINGKTRESRLISSIPKYITRSMGTIMRSYVTYSPLRTFCGLSVIPGVLGLILCIRFLWYYCFGSSSGGHIQSLILAAMLLLIAFMLVVIGVLSDLISANRKLIQDANYNFSLHRFKNIGNNKDKNDKSNNSI
jgi:glycosyltransferase involved in cell wall biosynthesis